LNKTESEKRRANTPIGFVSLLAPEKRAEYLDNNRLENANRPLSLGGKNDLSNFLLCKKIEGVLITKHPLLI
jgi:hypothetical protein